MLPWLTWGVVGLSTALLALSGWYAVRDRLLDDALLLGEALLALALVVLAVRGLLGLSHIGDDAERATFAAYVLSLPVIPLATTFLALKEKTRWAMGAVAVGAFAVAVMTVRVQQIWDATPLVLHG